MNNRCITCFSKEFIAFFLFILCFIYITGQLSTPYIRHDDWEFMTYLLPDMPHHGTPWNKTLWEGRWINYFWSFIARDFSVNANYLFFIIGYSLFSWIIGSYFSEKYITRFFIAIIAFFCSTYADLSLWPATLAPSVWISFITILTFRYYKSKVLLLFFLSALVMSYAPLVAVCFILLLSNHKGNLRQKITLGMIYYVGYILGVVIIYFLNYKYHDFLGVKIADWRNPNPLVSFDSLIENIKKTIYFWVNVINEYKIYLTISFILSLLLLKNDHKEKVLNLFIALFFVISFESTLSIYTGVDIPVRAIIWPWFFFVAIVGLTIQSINIKIRWLSILLACLLLLNGAEKWYGFYNYESKHARFENTLGSILRAQEQNDVYICGDVKKIKGLGGRELRPLTLAIWKKDGIYLKQATEQECSELPDSELGLQKIRDKIIYKFN